MSVLFKLKRITKSKTMKKLILLIGFISLGNIVNAQYSKLLDFAGTAKTEVHLKVPLFMMAHIFTE